MSSSKSSASTTSNITDRRIGATDEAVVVAEGGTAVITDQGAFDVAGRALDTANYAVAGSGQVARDLFNTASTVLIQSQNRALSTVDDAIDRSYDFSGEVVEDSLSTIEEVNLQAFKNVETANKSIADVSEQAIAKVEASTRSDAAQSFNKLLSTTAIIGVVVAVSLAVRK